MSKYFDSIKETFFPIPNAYCYVLSNDTFMSGWGHARHQTNTCVVPCQDMIQAQAVERYVKSRSDQKRVRIRKTKPQARAGVLYSLMPKWIEQAKNH